MTRTLSLSEVKIKLSQLVEGVVSKDDEIVITRNGRPVAVILNADEYESWKETQEIQSDTKLMREIRRGLTRLKKGQGRKARNLNQVFGEAV